MYKASAVSAYRYNHRRGQICRSHIRLIIFLSLCSILAFAEEETTDAKPAETKAATEEKASDISLPDVLVTANRTEVEKKKAASSYTVISGEELEKKKIRSLYEALRKSPGLTVSNAGAIPRSSCVEQTPGMSWF